MSVKVLNVLLGKMDSVKLCAREKCSTHRVRVRNCDITEYGDNQNTKENSL